VAPPSSSPAPAARSARARLGGGATTFDGRGEARDHRDGGGLVTRGISMTNGDSPHQRSRRRLRHHADAGHGVRLASSAAKIGFVFARRGVVPEAAALGFPAAAVGIAQAAEVDLHRPACSAEEARAGGL